MLVLNLPFKALMFLTLMRPSLVLFLVLWLKLVKDFLKVRCRLALLPFLISCLIWLDLVASLDRKSGSAGMPRPISYAVFCLKKKKRGVVILASPSLIIQDPTGGVSIANPHGLPLTIGEEVEASGRVRPGDFSSVLEDATVRVLWARSPTPAVSVTASQAATGAFDANFIELEGRLRRKDLGPNNTFILGFESGPEAFRAIVNRGRSDSFFKEVKVNSLLRLRGICLADAAYTENLTPFVVLLRSTEDLKVLAGPPWWNAGHLVGLVIGILVLTLVISVLYGRIEHWRLRAVLDERERLAHEVHDTLAQSFAGIGFQLDAIRNGVPKDLKIIHHQLDVASDLARHSHEEARRS